MWANALRRAADAVCFHADAVRRVTVAGSPGRAGGGAGARASVVPCGMPAGLA